MWNEARRKTTASAQAAQTEWGGDAIHEHLLQRISLVFHEVLALRAVKWQRHDNATIINSSNGGAPVSFAGSANPYFVHASGPASAACFHEPSQFVFGAPFVLGDGVPPTWSLPHRLWEYRQISALPGNLRS